MVLIIHMCVTTQQGLMEHHEEVVEYFNRNGVAAIFLFRRNLLRRLISVLANSYDKDAKLLNGIHKSHVHSPVEVSLSLSLTLFSLSLSHFSWTIKYMLQAQILAKYKPKINATLLMPELKQTAETSAKAIQYFTTTYHIVLYYEDVIRNRTVMCFYFYFYHNYYFFFLFLIIWIEWFNLFSLCRNLRTFRSFWNYLTESLRAARLRSTLPLYLIKLITGMMFRPHSKGLLMRLSSMQIINLSTSKPRCK